MRRLTPLFALVALAILFGLAQAQELTIHFVDVGQGDGVLIQSPSGQNAVYDGGRSSQGMLDYLEAHVSRVLAWLSPATPMLTTSAAWRQ